MATNELAAILARRRAKDGSGAGQPAIERASPGTESTSAASPIASAPAPATSPDAPHRSSIAERIARLQQQSAAASGAPPPVPMQIPTHASSCAHAGAPAGPATESPDRSVEPTPASAPETTVENTPSGDDAGNAATGNRRTSSKIQQLQGSLGINVNPFGGGPPGGFRKTGSSGVGGGNSIMTTGDQYAHTHGMGIAMPGMGAAIPMPGLAKAGTRIPGMSEPSPEAEVASATESLEASHATMSRATGPRRAGRGGPPRPPPGAVRMPMPSTVDPPIAPIAPLPTPGSSEVSADTGAPSLFGASPTTPQNPQEPSLSSLAPNQLPPPVGEVAPPASSSTVGARQVDSAEALPMARISLEESSGAQKDPTESASLFGAPSQWNPSAASSVSTQSPPAHPPVTMTPPPATFVAPSSNPRPPLFGSASTGNDDESDDSDWSDDEGNKESNQPTLFGAPVPSASATASGTSAPQTMASTTPAPSTSSLFGSPSPGSGLSPGVVVEAQSTNGVSASDSGSLFGPSTSVSNPPTAPAPHVAPPAAASNNNLFGPPPGAVAAVARPPSQYNSLFGPDDEDSDESDDEGGLFGTGLPTSR